MTVKTGHTEASTAQREVSIKQDGDILQLVFASEPDAIQSAINCRQPQQLVMQNLQYLMGILLFMKAPEKILLLGVGAGSLIQFFRYYFPESHITGVELDDELLHFAQAELLLPQADDRLQYVIQDAREYIDNNRQQYDLIMVDIFNGSQSPDWTREKDFTELLKSALTDQGAVAYNTLISSESEFNGFYKLLRQTFAGQTLCLETEQYENLLLYGLNFTSEKKSMMDNLQLALAKEEKYPLPFRQILSTIYDINPVDCGII